MQFADNYFELLFPKSEDYAYLIKKVDEAYALAMKYKIDTVSNKLAGKKDEINVKMRAIEAFSKFEANNTH